MVEDRGEASDEMLMVRYQRGDRHAFAELVRRYQKPVFNFALRQLRQPNAAEDVTQETFLRVVQNASEFKHEARFSTWLFTIARNHCIDQLRKLEHRRHPSLDQPIEEGAGRTLGDAVADGHPRASTERAAAGSEVATRIVQALEALPDDQREVFLLRELANLPFKEIAKVTGAGENTVKSRMRYALDRLQEALSEFEEYARALR
jgi:RNA polymerase sigma-70 factor (ECF subfamily)